MNRSLKLITILMLTGCGQDQQQALLATTATETTTEIATATSTSVDTKKSAKAATPAKTATKSVASTDQAVKLMTAGCLDPKVDEIKAGVKIMLCNGEIVEGTLVGNTAVNSTASATGTETSAAVTSAVTNTHTDCDQDGQIGCIANNGFKAVDSSKLTSGNIRSGVIIAGVTGTASTSVVTVVQTQVVTSVVTNTVTVPDTTPACTENAQVGCVTTTTYKAANLANLSAGNIKSGVTIAGVSGQYPSASFPITNASSVADLDLATFDAKIKSVTAFEWFDSSGTRYTYNGDADLDAANIKTGVSVFGSVGTVDTIPYIDPFDLRTGVTVGSNVGKLLGSETMQDMLGGSSTPFSFGYDPRWGVTCNRATENCGQTWDRKTKLSWSKGSIHHSMGVYAGPSYSGAVTYCGMIDVSGGMIPWRNTPWRLPTAKELQEAIVDGLLPVQTIPSAASAQYYWTSTVASTGSMVGVYVGQTASDLQRGQTTSLNSSTASASYICVHD